MKKSLAVTVRVAFGLGFDVEKEPGRKSQFKPARIDLGAHEELFAQERLDGFASLIRISFAKKLVIVGGNEGRYKDETPVINRAEAASQMLVKDYGLSPEQVEGIASNSNTGGNIAVIRQYMRANNLTGSQCAVVSNHYHIPRALVMTVNEGLSIRRLYPAESFWLIENGNENRNHLIQAFGGGRYEKRSVVEIQGIADLLRGTYTARTDAPAVRIEGQSVSQ